MTFRDSLSRLERTHDRAILKLTLVRVGWAALLLAGLCGMADLLFVLSDNQRLYSTFACLVLLVLLLFGSVALLRRARSRVRKLVRLIEESEPALDNTLINATDFEEALERKDLPEISSALMQTEIAAAAARVSALPDLKALMPRSFNRERLLLVSLLSLLVLAFLAAPHVLRALLPRFIDPYGDHPPYHTIRLDVQPAGISVDYGESIKVIALATGGQPETVSLVLWDLEGNEISASPMFHEGEGMYFQTIENVDRDLEYFVRIDRGRSHRYPLTVNKTPKILDVVATFRPPAYTFREPETNLLAEPLLRGYKNTQVELSVSSNRPLSGGTLSISDREYPLGPGDNSKAIGSFPLLEDGPFELTVEDVEGNRSHPEYRGKVEIVPDEKPEIVIAEPGMDSFAVPDSKVPLAIDAFDDLGLVRIVLFRNHNGSDDMKKILYEGPGDRSEIGVTETLDLKDLGVRPGDTIEYYATATDSHPESPQTASTDPFRLVIISFEEYREFVQSQMTAADLKEKYDRYLEEMNRMAESQETLRQETEQLQEEAGMEGGLSPERSERLERAEREQQELEEWARELAEKFQEESEKQAIFDIEKDYKESLRGFAESLAAARDRMNEAKQALEQAAQGEPSNSDPDSSQAPSLGMAGEKQKEALDHLRQNIEDFQAGISEPNENLEKVTDVIADTERFKYLYTLQKSLERQIRYYKDMPRPSLDDQIRLNELSEQQAKVQDELKLLRALFETHADELEKLAAEQKSKEEE